MSYYSSNVPPIQMSELYPTPPNNADVKVYLINSSTNALAWTQCASGAIYGGSDASHTRWCIPQILYCNTRFEADYFPSDTAKRYIACHELGHTIGLRHPGSGETLTTCMRSATITPKYVPSHTTISAVEKSQVASYY